MTGAHIRNRPTPTYGIAKVHFSHSGITYCIVKPSFLGTEQTEDWGKVTCRNCKAGRSSKEWREKVQSKAEN